jgi:hypothetical protein
LADCGLSLQSAIWYRFLQCAAGSGVLEANFPVASSLGASRIYFIPPRWQTGRFIKEAGDRSTQSPCLDQRITDLPTRLQPTKGGQQVFVQPLSISGIAERPTGEETIPPNQQNETKQCDSWL